MILKTPAGSEFRNESFRKWGTTLVPVEWKVVAGPPGAPTTMSTLEDPARQPVLIRERKVS